MPLDSPVPAPFGYFLLDKTYSLTLYFSRLRTFTTCLEWHSVYNGGEKAPSFDGVTSIPPCIHIFQSQTLLENEVSR